MIIGNHVKIVRWPLKKRNTKDNIKYVAIWVKMCHKKHLQVMHCLTSKRLMQNETQDFEA